MLKRTSLLCTLAMLLACSVSYGQLERLYVTTSDGHLLAIDGLNAGTHDRGMPGDNTINDVHQPGVHHTVLGVGNETSVHGLQVVAGAVDAVVRVFNADLSVNTFNKPLSGAGNAISAVQVGSLNGLNHSIVASHGWLDGGGNRGTNVFTMSPDLVTNHTINTIPNILIKDAKLAEVDGSFTGNELVLGGINDVTQDPSSATLFKYRWDGANTTWAGQSGPLNNHLEAIAVGDGKIVDVGANAAGPNPAVISDSSQAFDGNFGFQWFNAGPSIGTLVDAEFGDLFSDPGLEYIAAGDQAIFIVDAQSGAGSFQQINTGENNTSLILADVLGNDGALEIIVGTASGKIMAYEHSTPGDDTTGFVLAATLNLNLGAGDYGVTDLQSVTIPEPATMTLLTLGTLGVLRRRKR